MVDFGPRLTGSDAHDGFIRWRAWLTLTATRKTVPCPTVTAVLPGASREMIIFNTHTDGQGFVEENAPVAFVHLARHFASLPAGRRLKRTLVFANWPGHMSNDLPQAQGWMDVHKDLVDRAAAALTVEHLGCSEWADSLDRGYHPTGRAELFAVWASQGKMFELTRDAVVKQDLPRTALLRPPAQFGVGGPFHQAGVPQIGAIAGPEYLLTVSDSGDMDKLDERLAARQIAFLADLTTALDPVSARELRAGDQTLGSPAPKGNIEPSDAVPKAARCGPEETFVVAAGGGKSFSVRWYGRRHALHGILIVLGSGGGLTCVLTVASLSTRSAAISRLERPRAMWVRTSSSRGMSSAIAGEGSLGEARRANCSIRRLRSSLGIGSPCGSRVGWLSLLAMSFSRSSEM